MKKTIVLFLFFSISVMGQKPQDLAVWPGVKLTKEFSQKFEARAFVQNRLNENASQVSNIFVDLGITRIFSKKFELTYAYVFNNTFDFEQGLRRQHQTYINALFKLKIKKFGVKYRPLVQYQIYENYLQDYLTRSKLYLRNKLILSYSITKNVAPFVFAEPRQILALNDRAFTVNRFRTAAGLHIEISERSDIDLYYMRQETFNVKRPAITNVIGVAYNLKFF